MSASSYSRPEVLWSRPAQHPVNAPASWFRRGQFISSPSSPMDTKGSISGRAKVELVQTASTYRIDRPHR